MSNYAGGMWERSGPGAERADDGVNMGPESRRSPAGVPSTVALELRRMSARDRPLLEQFVMDDPAYTRISFGQEPSSRDVDALLGAGPDGARPGAQQVVGAFSGTGILVGVVQSVNRWPTPVSCYIGLLQVHPAHRGQGIGTRLLAATEQTARAQECRQLLLSVITRNTGARTFWHRQGFHLLTPHRARTVGPCEPVLMHRPL